MVNGILGWVHTLPVLGWLPASLQKLFGIVFAPVAWLMGVSWKDAATVGNLLGTRLVLNEFVAFLQLGPAEGAARPALLHHRHLRAVRLRQLQLHRDSDRRHRRAGAQPQVGPGAAGPAARWPPARWRTSCPPASRECCCDRRSQALHLESRVAPRGRVSPWCSAAAWARSPRNSPTRIEIPYSEIPGLAALDRRGPRRQAGRSARLGGQPKSR